MITQSDILTIAEHYIQALLWSSVDLSEEPEPLDDQGYTLTAKAEIKALAIVSSFIADNWELVSEYLEQGQTLEQLGHDLWLTSEGHGVGFWDRGLGKLGTKLTAASKMYQTSYFPDSETLKVDLT